MVSRVRFLAIAILLGAGSSRAADISGQVKLPELCGSSVSPAVVRLEPIEARAHVTTGESGEPKLIDQRGLTFQPRVVALRVGQTLRFGNADPESHNVHLRGAGAGAKFNRNVPPGETIAFVPDEPGVFKVVCDVHNHMRAFVVVGASPWIATCGLDGGYRFHDVPRGSYRLLVWHEMTQTLGADVTVGDGDLDLGPLAATLGPNTVTADDLEQVCLTGCEPWPLVIDRISVTLATSLAAARRPETAGTAMALAQDAYHRDLEASGLKTAVRVHLGWDRAAKIEEAFREITLKTRDIAAREDSPTAVFDPTRLALLQLVEASAELNRKGVTERSNIFAKTSPAFFVEETPGRETEGDAASRSATARWDAYFPAGLAVALLVPLLLFALVVRSRRATAPLSPDGASSLSGGQLWRTTVPNRWVGALIGAAALGAIVAVILINRVPSGAGPGKGSTPAARKKPDTASAPAPAASKEAPPRAHQIGLGIERNHLRITALWHRPVRLAGPAPTAPGALYLMARIHATAGNPNGFAKGEWIPYLTVRYTVEPAKGGEALTGTLRPVMAADGPHYGNNLTLPGPGDYRLTLRIEPPSEAGLDRVVDPVSGVAPWWEGFDASERWSYRPD